MSGSLRRRLMLLMLLLILGSWLATAVFTLFNARRVFLEQVDQQLAQYTHLVTYVTHIFAHESDRGDRAPWYRENVEVELDNSLRIEGPLEGVMTPAVNVWFEGRLMATVHGSPRFEQPLEEGFRYSHEIPGEDWRLLARFDDDTQLWIVVGFELGQAQQSFLALVGRTLLPLIVVLPLSLLFLHWAVTRGLRPVEQLAEDIGSRQANLLDPLPAHSVPREVKPVVVALNALLSRLGRALESEQRFTANAAHELLTPLAAIKSEVQLCQRRLQAQGSADVLDGVVQRVDRATHSVEQLLALSRVDPDAPVVMVPIDLSALLEAILGETGALFEAADLSLRQSIAPNLVVRGNSELLAMLLRNLVNNALRYARPDSEVAVTARPNVNEVEVSVVNDCERLSADEFQQVRERFYRVPGSRGAGAGFGLSIVTRVAEQHGASLVIEPAKPDGCGFCVRLALPAQPALNSGA